MATEEVPDWAKRERETQAKWEAVKTAARVGMSERQVEILAELEEIDDEAKGHLASCHELGERFDELYGEGVSLGLTAKQMYEVVGKEGILGIFEEPLKDRVVRGREHEPVQFASGRGGLTRNPSI